MPLQHLTEIIFYKNMKTNVLDDIITARWQFSKHNRCTTKALATVICHCYVVLERYTFGHEFQHEFLDD